LISFLILQIDPDYSPGPMERRTIFGVTLEQKRNDALVDASFFSNVVTNRSTVCSIPILLMQFSPELRMSVMFFFSTFLLLSQMGEKDKRALPISLVLSHPPLNEHDRSSLSVHFVII
jgi:hypothetical protein